MVNVSCVARAPRNRNIMRRPHHENSDSLHARQANNIDARHRFYRYEIRHGRGARSAMRHGRPSRPCAIKRMRVTYHCVLTLREFPGNVLSSPFDEVDGVWRFKEMSSIANARLRAE